MIFAQFELMNILVEGNCYEINSAHRMLQAPPRGLELVLGTPSVPNKVDTIVMSNLGYFQLKANPGVWNLGLKKGTRSTELYKIYSGDSNKDEHVVVLSSFSGAFVPLRVTLFNQSFIFAGTEVARKRG